MALNSYTRAMLLYETRSLLARLARVKSFALQETMLPAAALLPRAQSAIDKYLVVGRRQLRRHLHQFLRWLQHPISEMATPEEAQRRFTMLRLKFNVVLTQFDLFSDVITQRSESEIGVWLGGLDVVSADALELPGYYEAPPVICYLDRDIGAAIRRARTRLPGGGRNPVAVIRVPRERMIGTGIASSLVHEVGHQAAALLDLVNSLRQILKDLQRGPAASRLSWQLWERWISEIVADFWSVARVGVASTIGLMGVVSLPRPFVFRLGRAVDFTPNHEVDLCGHATLATATDDGADPELQVVERLLDVDLDDRPRRAELLGQVLTFFQAGDEEGGAEAAQARLQQNEGDSAARYIVAAAHARSGRLAEALENLLTLIQRDRRHRDDGARRALLTLFQYLGQASGPEQDLIHECRRRLQLLI